MKLRVYLNLWGMSEDRPKVGALINEVKVEIETQINLQKQIILKNELEINFIKEKIDVTLSGRKVPMGNAHPLQLVLDEIEEIFLGLGFMIEEGPEIDSDYNTFKALNFPDDHPARDSQDTLYVNKDIL